MLLQRDLAYHECELRFQKTPGRFEGYASVFGGVDSYGDTIEKGAFAVTLNDRKRMPLMLFGHNPSRMMGKWLSLKEDGRGLYGEGEFTAGNTDAQNVYASLKHGAIDGLSIGFRIPKGGFEDNEKTGGRIIKAIDLVEISVVTMPADDAARIQSVKASIEALASMRDIETYLRDSGMSRGTAQSLLSRVKSLVLSDSARGQGDEVAEVRSRLFQLAQKPESILRNVS